MFFSRIFILAITILIIFLSNIYSAPNGIITLDHIDGNVAGNQIGSGDLYFYFRVNLFNESDNVKGYTNGFRFYSPEGATWSPLIGDTLNGVNDNFDLISGIGYIGVTGSGADTISFYGLILQDIGWVPGFNQVCFSVQTAINTSDHGKTLCVDSSWYPPTGRWLWSGGAAGTVPPEWGGPYCFKINDCVGTIGPDRDSDGLPDDCDDCPDDPDNDIDNDGVCGDVDNCPNINNPLQEDADGDSSGDACDSCTDLDNDGYGNVGYPNNTCPDDNCPDISNPNQSDADNDGFGDECDACTDTDNDGFGNPGFAANTCPDDNCPQDYNPDQIDADGDGLGDECDDCYDSDGDGYGDPGHPENLCSEDNCPDIYNISQSDADGDGIGNSCDECTDTDGDGFGNPGYSANTCPDDNCPSDYNPLQEDENENGIGDACEVITGSFKIASDLRCGDSPLVVNFTIEGPFSEDIWIEDVYWNFGDGTTGTGLSPIHVYNEVGIYNVRVTYVLHYEEFISDDNLFERKYITTLTEINADLTAVPQKGQAPLTVFFDANIDGIANEFHWDFGDGETSDQQNPIHIYEQNGLYDVRLVASLTLSGCNIEEVVLKEGLIKVSDLVPEFSADNTVGVAPFVVHFQNNTSGSYQDRLWDFGEGGSSVVDNPIYTFDTVGNYDVTLKVWDLLNNPDSILKLDYIRVVDSSFVNLALDVSSSIASPNQDMTIWVNWVNLGSKPADNCTLKVLLPDEIDFISIYNDINQSGTYTGFTTSSDTTIIPLETIVPTNWVGGYIGIIGNLSPSVNIGDSIVVKAWIESSDDDLYIFDNYFEYYAEIFEYSNENEKYANPGGRALSSEIDPGQRITYVINYKNISNIVSDTVFLRIVDTLSDKLDWSTFAVGEISQPETCQWQFDIYTGEFVWYCDSLILPFDSSGYFTFSISPQDDLEALTEIPNRAWIRFDYKPWIKIPGGQDDLIRIIRYIPCCKNIRGNIDYDDRDVIDIADLVYFAEYMFDLPPGPAPECFEEADVEGSNEIDIEDLVYLVEYTFDIPSGPAPVDCPE
ncbi:PKD domain-containing protein [Candidatus Zixiibacteriota bacterium]